MNKEISQLRNITEYSRNSVELNVDDSYDVTDLIESLKSIKEDGFNSLVIEIENDYDGYSTEVILNPYKKRIETLGELESRLEREIEASKQVKDRELETIKRLAKLHNIKLL